MVVIDASVWVSFYKNDDKFHERAKNIIRSLRAAQEKICIPAIAFTEVAGVIKRTAKNVTAESVVRSMKKLKLQVWGDFDKLEPYATEIAINFGVRGMDAYYLAVAEISKSKLYTFDNQQEEAFETISKNW